MSDSGGSKVTLNPQQSRDRLLIVVDPNCDSCDRTTAKLKKVAAKEAATLLARFLMRKAVLAISLLLFVAACATNPATGKSEINFFSEEQEIAMGKEAHEEILQELAVYEERPELNAMVDRIGKRIAADSPRPQLPWTFTLLDTPMVNAMALPGGYVYVTRGILERMNTEDELAGVIGHEVAHVAARHSTASMSRGTLAQVGLVAAAVIAGEENTQKYGAIAMIGAGLLFTKYSRGQETQADLLGTKYMAGSGYNPRGSELMLGALQRLEGGRVSTIERYFMDHPDPKKRVQDVQREIGELRTADASVVDRPMDRAAFVRKLDGMVTGNSTATTRIRDGVVYNRTYGLVAPAPRGWRAAIESGSLFAFHREGESGEVIYAQAIEDAANARQEIREELEKAGLTRVDSNEGIDYWRGESDGTKFYAQTAHRRSGDGAVAFLLVAANDDSPALGQLLERVETGSERAYRMKPPRLRVVTSRRGDTWSELARRATGNAEDAAAIANLNGFDFPSEVPVGILLKIPEEVGTDAS